MIYFLEGRVISKEEKFIILEVRDIGFKIFCSPSTVDKAILAKEIKIFTYLTLEREKLQLYGFASQEELELFETLNNISGIGVKTALLLSSFGSLEKLKRVIESDKQLATIKGIGKKRLQRIILELTGKIKELESKRELKIPEKEETLEALKALGFSKEEARTALLEVPPEIKDSEERVKAALKILGRK